MKPWEIDFDSERKMYLERLNECRSDLVKKNTEKENREAYFDIILDPRNEDELGIGRAFLCFLDDNKQISDNAMAGKIKAIDIDTSDGVLYASRIIDSLNCGRELGLEEGEFYTNPSLFARVLYDLTVLIQTSDIGQVIADRNGYDMNNRSDSDQIRSVDHITGLCIHLREVMLNSSIFRKVDRNNPNFDEAFFDFMDMCDAFHSEYLKGILDDTKNAPVQYVKQ